MKKERLKNPRFLGLSDVYQQQTFRHARLRPGIFPNSQKQDLRSSDKPKESWAEMIYVIVVADVNIRNAMLQSDVLCISFEFS